MKTCLAQRMAKIPLNDSCKPQNSTYFHFLFESSPFYLKVFLKIESNEIKSNSNHHQCFSPHVHFGPDMRDMTFAHIY